MNLYYDIFPKDPELAQDVLYFFWSNSAQLLGNIDIDTNINIGLVPRGKYNIVGQMQSIIYRAMYSNKKTKKILLIADSHYKNKNIFFQKSSIYNVLGDINIGDTQDVLDKDLFNNIQYGGHSDIDIDLVSQLTYISVYHPMDIYLAYLDLSTNTKILGQYIKKHILAKNSDIFVLFVDDITSYVDIDMTSEDIYDMDWDYVDDIYQSIPTSFYNYTHQVFFQILRKSSMRILSYHNKFVDTESKNISYTYFTSKDGKKISKSYISVIGISSLR